MQIAISNIADKFKFKFIRLFNAYGPEVLVRVTIKSDLIWT